MNLLADFNVQLLRLYVLGGIAAYVVFALVGAVPWGRLGRRNRLTQFAGLNDSRATVAVGSAAFRVRLAFQKWGLDVTGHEMEALWLARIIAGVVLGGLLLAFGLPPLLAVAGFAVVWFVLDGLVADAWRQMVNALERDVPTFLTRLASVAQVTPNALVAVGEVAETFSASSPLRAWLERFTARLQAQGRSDLADLLAEAQLISPALGVAVYEIGRLWETGGEGYLAAFAQTADNLGEVLSGRAQAMAKGEGAKGSMRVIVVVLVEVMFIFLRTPLFASALRQPVLQAVYAGLVVWIALGWNITGGMIEEAVQ